MKSIVSKLIVVIVTCLIVGVIGIYVMQEQDYVDKSEEVFSSHGVIPGILPDNVDSLEEEEERVQGIYIIQLAPVLVEGKQVYVSLELKSRSDYSALRGQQDVLAQQITPYLEHIGDMEAQHVYYALRERMLTALNEVYYPIVIHNLIIHL